MSLFQSNAANGRETAPGAFQAGIVTKAIFSYTFSTAYATATDKIEIGLIPANTQVLGLQVFGDNMGAVTADVGIMSGTPGAVDNARTVGTEFLNDQSVADGTIGAATIEACLAVARSDSHRGLGVTISGNITAASNKKVTVVLEYVA